MNTIQIFLILGTLICLLVYLRYFRTLLRDRLIAVVLFGMALVSIMFPKVTTIAANLVGVGRGADLLIYISVTSSIFLFVLMFTRIKKLESDHVKLIRYLAIKEAEKNSLTT